MGSEGHCVEKLIMKKEETIQDRIVGVDLIVDINLVEPNTWNPKDDLTNTENRKIYEDIKKGIETKGLFESITVRELPEGRYQILDGFHRYTACNEIGYTRIRINNLGVVNDQLARAITLIKEQKRIPLNEVKVSDLVYELSLVIPNFTDLSELLILDEGKVEEYINMHSFDWSFGDNAAEPDTTGKDSKQTTCPECGHVF